MIQLLVFGLLDEGCHAPVDVGLPVAVLDGPQVLERDGDVLAEVGAPALPEQLVRHLVNGEMQSDGPRAA